MRFELLEDRIGDSGRDFRAALGLKLSQRGDPGDPDFQVGFGATVDDMVVEWREFQFVEDTASCDSVMMSGPGEPHILGVRKDPATGAILIEYDPACFAVDNNIEIGPLEMVSSYAYSWHDCSIGNTGAYGFNPGSGDYFFLIVANDGEGKEGSYGRNSSNEERPEDQTDWSCSLVQSLGNRCDQP